MQILLIRHGIAEDREAWSGRDDDLRPLTKQGRWKMERNARGLRRVVRAIDVLVSSPRRRALQTATIVGEAYGRTDVETLASLAPDAPPQEMLAWLRRRGAAQTIAAVGHEPALSTLGTWLLTGLAESRIVLRKGGACLLEFDGRPAAGRGQLLSALTPSILRRLAD